MSDVHPSKMLHFVRQIGTLLFVPILTVNTAATTARPASCGSERAKLPVRYTITDLGTLSGDVSSTAFSINARGDVVGRSGEAFDFGHSKLDSRSFLYSGGKMSEIGRALRPPSSPRERVYSQAVKINKVGDVLIETTISKSAQRWNPRISLWNRRRETLVNPPHGYIWDWPSGVKNNDRGDIVGSVVKASSSGSGTGGSVYPVIRHAGKFTMLPTIRGYPCSMPVAIDNGGHVLCNADDGLANKLVSCSYVVDGGRTIALGRIGKQHTFAFGMNDRMEVVGNSDLLKDGQTIGRPFLWDRTHGIRILPSLGGITCYATAINNHSVIVGSAILPAPKRALNAADTEMPPLPPLHACVWNNGQICDLNDLIPQNTGWVLSMVMAINDRGEIVGSGEVHGKTHAFLLTPEVSHD